MIGFSSAVTSHGRDLYSNYSTVRTGIPVAPSGVCEFHSLLAVPTGSKEVDSINQTARKSGVARLQASNED